MREWVFSDIFSAFEALFRAHWLLAPWWVSPLSGRCTHLNAGPGTWLCLGPGTELLWTLGRTMSSAATASRQKSEEFQKWQLKARFGSMVIQDFSFEGHNWRNKIWNRIIWDGKEMKMVEMIVYCKGKKQLRCTNQRSKMQEWQWQTCVYNVPLSEFSNIY